LTYLFALAKLIILPVNKNQQLLKFVKKLTGKLL
jgi:hypothetical protein